MKKKFIFFAASGLGSWWVPGGAWESRGSWDFEGTKIWNVMQTTCDGAHVLAPCRPRLSDRGQRKGGQSGGRRGTQLV